MDIATTATATTTRGTAAPQANGRLTSDFDTFLKMLTTQMQNQDPLNPLDSADFAVQLATFSGVEQQMRTNQTLEAVLARLDMQGMAQMAGWVGNEARSAAPVAFDGAPVTIYPAEAGPSVDRRVLSVRDAQGNLVAREDVPARAATHLWQGQAITGGPLPPGRYSLTVESYSGEGLVSSASPETYAVIEEVRSTAQGTRLVLAGGAEIATDAVTALRR
ncbi:MAG: flagellar hook capping FlgD N-terminal domain-containing protein [Gemmobacter sp.]